MLDSTATDNHGTAQGGMDAGDLIDAKIGRGLYLDGSDYLTVADHDAVDPTAAWTLSAWVKRAATGSQHGLIEKYNWQGGHGTYGMRVTAANAAMAFTVDGTSADMAHGTSALVAGTIVVLK
jgi:hypothetical protein